MCISWCHPNRKETLHAEVNVDYVLHGRLSTKCGQVTWVTSGSSETICWKMTLCSTTLVKCLHKPECWYVNVICAPMMLVYFIQPKCGAITVHQNQLKRKNTVNLHVNSLQPWWKSHKKWHKPFLGFTGVVVCFYFEISNLWICPQMYWVCFGPFPIVPSSLVKTQPAGLHNKPSN